METWVGVAIVVVGIAVAGGILRTRAIRRTKLATLRRLTGQWVHAVIGSHWSQLGRGRSFFDATLTLGTLHERRGDVTVDLADIEVVEPAWDVYLGARGADRRDG